MSEITLGIIGGGQLGSMLAIAAKKLNINTVIFSDDIEWCKNNIKSESVVNIERNNIIFL